MENPFRVPKTGVEVQVSMMGCRPQGVELFVSEAETAAGPDLAVMKLLEETSSFLPARSTGDRWTLINTASLLWVSIAAPPTVTRLRMYDHRAFVQAVFVDGSSVDGELLYTPPSTHGRVADHLCRPERFFTLHRRAAVIVVNKALVATLSEVDTLTPTEGV